MAASAATSAMSLLSPGKYEGQQISIPTIEGGSATSSYTFKGGRWRKDAALGEGGGVSMGPPVKPPPPDKPLQLPKGPGGSYTFGGPNSGGGNRSGGGGGGNSGGGSTGAGSGSGRSGTPSAPALEGLIGAGGNPGTVGGGMGAGGSSNVPVNSAPPIDPMSSFLTGAESSAGGINLSAPGAGRDGIGQRTPPSLAALLRVRSY